MAIYTPPKVDIKYSDRIEINYENSFVGNGTTGLANGYSPTNCQVFRFKTLYEGTDNEIFFLVDAENHSDHVGNVGGNGLVMGMSLAQATCFYKVSPSDGFAYFYTADNSSAIVSVPGVGLGLGDPAGAIKFSIY